LSSNQPATITVQAPTVGDLQQSLDKLDANGNIIGAKDDLKKASARLDTWLAENDSSHKSTGDQMLGADRSTVLGTSRAWPQNEESASDHIVYYQCGDKTCLVTFHPVKNYDEWRALKDTGSELIDGAAFFASIGAGNSFGSGPILMSYKGNERLWVTYSDGKQDWVTYDELPSGHLFFVAIKGELTPKPNVTAVPTQ